jgi:hypothetical protein
MGQRCSGVLEEVMGGRCASIIEVCLTLSEPSTQPYATSISTQSLGFTPVH